ncbi:MAG: hypothetical protein GX443_14775 [Deltaproteobacteria bacterium]|nr:hypothetical protein [Deltaproteobacteria bacterium]
MTRVDGCTIEMLDTKTCNAFLTWVSGGNKKPEGAEGLGWLLAHCHDGVTWGRLGEDGLVWLVSSAVFPDLSPAISASNLLEMRLFGKGKEVLIWRSEAEFSGRCLSDDAGDPKGGDSPTRPDDETRILLGDRLLAGPKDGFSRVGTASGREQAVPLECTEQDFTGGRQPLRVRVRHYFEQDSQTGAVRVAASRLVDIFKEVR